MKKITETEIAIAERFFFALEELARMRVIRGLQTFTRRHGINYGNMNRRKNNRAVQGVKADYLAFLAEDYGISCEWLLLGNGDMFANGSPALA